MISLKELNPLQKVTLRFAVISLLFYGLSVVEGMMMRAELAGAPILEPEHYFAVMNARPIVGSFGCSFMLVMGAFYFLVPTFTKKELYSIFLAELNWLVMAAGTGIVWLSSFIFRYSALYTNYWPLPILGSTGVSLGLFAIGMILIMIGILIFCFNLFATVFHRQPGDKPLSALVISAFGLDGFINIFNRLRGRPDKVIEPDVPLPIVAIFRGTIDTVLDALVLGSVAIVFL